jgi:hypothetical protein
MSEFGGACTAIIAVVIVVKEATEADATAVTGNWTLPFGAGRGNINHLVEVYARGVATAEAALDLDILYCELSQDADDISPNDRQGLAAGGRDTEKSLQEYGFG